MDRRLRHVRNHISVMHLTLLVWGALAIVARPWAPWLIWLLPFVIGLFLIAEDVACWDKGAKRTVAGVTCGLLALHTILAILRGQGYTAEVDTLWNDDHLFYTQAAALTEAWQNGSYVDITQRGNPPYMGTLHVGYQRALAALFFIAGTSTLVGLLFNALCSAMIPVTVASIAFSLFGKTAADKKEKLIIAAFVIAALHPSQFYWNAFLLKDVFLTLLFLITVYLAVRAMQSREPVALVGLISGLVFLYYVRAYATFSILIGVAGWMALFLNRKWAVISTGFIILIMYMLINYTERGSYQFGRLWASIMFLAPDAAITSYGMVSQIFKSIPRFVLTPYAWLIVPVKDPLYGLYPGSWYLYTVVYPLAAAGFWVAIRKNISIAALPVLCFWGSAFILIMSSYEGNASRQRYYLEYLVIIFAAAGIVWPNRVAMLTTAGLIAAFAIGQLLSLN